MGRRVGGSITCTTSWPTQPDLNFHNPDVQDALLDTMRFWLERGVDGFRLDTVNYYFHDAQLRSNPPLTAQRVAPAVNPYDMQDHRLFQDPAREPRLPANGCGR